MSKLNKIEDVINKFQNIIIFGSLDCIYTKKAISLCKKHNIKCICYDITKYIPNFFDYLKKLSIISLKYEINTSYNKIPVIFYNHKFIGGYTDMAKIFRQIK